MKSLLMTGKKMINPLNEKDNIIKEIKESELRVPVESIIITKHLM